MFPFFFILIKYSTMPTRIEISKQTLAKRTTELKDMKKKMSEFKKENKKDAKTKMYESRISQMTKSIKKLETDIADRKEKLKMMKLKHDAKKKEKKPSKKSKGQKGGDLFRSEFNRMTGCDVGSAASNSRSAMKLFVEKLGLFNNSDDYVFFTPTVEDPSFNLDTFINTEVSVGVPVLGKKRFLDRKNNPKLYSSVTKPIWDNIAIEFLKHPLDERGAYNAIGDRVPEKAVAALSKLDRAKRTPEYINAVINAVMLLNK
jgi:hypothetical protein